MNDQRVQQPPRAYVVGFLFSQHMHQVLLIQKERPDWQRGKLNGVGGKIEAGETPHEAMVREFAEETGLQIRQWMPYHVERFRSGTAVHYFAAKDAHLERARTMTDEALQIARVDRGWPLPNLIYNTHYLVEMGRTLLLEPIDNIPVLP